MHDLGQGVDGHERPLPFLQSSASRAELLRRLRTALTDGTLRPGDRLPNERHIASASGLSRSTVREVLRDLNREGHLSRYVGRGTFVSQGNGAIGSPDAPDIQTMPLSPRELMEFRAAVEPGLANLVVLNATETQLARLVDIVEHSRDAARPEEAELADRLFHEGLFMATGNRFFGDLGRRISSVRAETAWMKLKGNTFTPQKWRVYWTEHRSISSALNDRDAERAAALLRAHLTGVRDAASLFA
ncbi:MAG TPA: FCD domain-containing protein [Lichenihabitans sp.]|jgi:DNA-binding FadR family transcriptional regulator|nr:FCD domain-containing protein [Lichenihabitans sp.]